ncbi:MAG: hypothetical protein Q9225_001752 [Loekoesia sp. 1 TL-2023]
MKFGYTILYVKDVRLTLDFYEKAFGFPTRFVIPTNDYGELNLSGGTTLAFAAENFVEKSLGPERFRLNRKDDAHAPGAEISFVTEKGENIQEVFQRAVEAGAAVVAEPTEKPWGQVVAYIRDCNGFLVEICTPVDESKEK